MSDLQFDSRLLTRPDQSILRSKLNEIVIEKITVTDLIATNLNGVPISGSLVSTNAVQTLSNKSLVDSSTYIVDSSNATIRAMIDASGVANTLMVLRTNIMAPGTTRTYTFNDVGSDASVVLTEGTQTINGVKTFTALTVTGSAMDSITKITSAGTAINTIQLDHVTAGGQPTDIIRSTSTESDINMSIIPKGLGFISFGLPGIDGNIRGQSSIDLQLTRDAPTQVASGNRSVVLGSYNTASADNSYAIGYRATVSHDGSMVLSDTTGVSSSSVNQLTTQFTGGYRMLGGSHNINDTFIKYNQASTTTIDVATSTISLLTLADNHSYIVQTNIIGTESGQSAFIRYHNKINVSSGAVTIGSAFDKYIISDFASIDAVTTSSGLNLQVTVTGSATHTIIWKVTCEIIQSTN